MSPIIYINLTASILSFLIYGLVFYVPILLGWILLSCFSFWMYASLFATTWHVSSVRVAVAIWVGFAPGLGCIIAGLNSEGDQALILWISGLQGLAWMGFPVIPFDLKPTIRYVYLWVVPIGLEMPMLMTLGKYEWYLAFAYMFAIQTIVILIATPIELYLNRPIGPPNEIGPPAYSNI